MMTVISSQIEERAGKMRRVVTAKCNCGNVKTILLENLVRTVSCGCHRARVRVLTGINAHACPEYGAWASMKARCENPRHRRFADWGGRGISVCAAWSASFPMFFASMGKKPSPQHTLDRLNNDGNYEPGNCRWATSKEQAGNRRHCDTGVPNKRLRKKTGKTHKTRRS